VTTPEPIPDSVLDALGHGFRVLRRPEFLWAPILLATLMALPLAFFPALLDPSAITRDTEAMTELLRRAIPTIVASLVIGLVLGPISGAVCFRLARQFLDGEEASPFGAGVVRLAVRLFIQACLLGLVALLVIGLTLLVGLAVIGAAGPALAVILFITVTLITAFVLGVRFSVAPVLALEGASALDGLRGSWRMTAKHDGQILRWLIASAVLVGLASTIGSEIVSAVFDALGLRTAGLLLGGAIVAPLSIVTSVVLIRLRHVLGTPPAPARPDPGLPDWLRPPPSDEVS
jgi:hypothetical protein